MRTSAAPRVPQRYQSPLPAMNLSELEVTLHTGDIVFTRIRGTPFRQLADLTRTWTNHVGIVVGFDSFGAVVAESRFPFSSRTRFANFVRRSAHGRGRVAAVSAAI
jgi:Permuted papain-like amidase enzyme, YaeF/YiiX, C92 family